MQKETKVNVNVDDFGVQSLSELCQLDEGTIEGIKSSLSAVKDILSTNKTLTDLYPDVLLEEPLDQSLFQERCFTFSERLTPHRKLRQCMLQLHEALNALYAVKDKHSEALIHKERLQLRLDEVRDKLSVADKLDKFDRRELELDKASYERELDSLEREIRSSANLIKDCAQKVAFYINLADRFKEEVQKTGLSFEEAEIVFFVMFFTRDIETQLKCQGRIDPGTYKSISQLPAPIRKKLFSNIDFLVSKLTSESSNVYTTEGDFLFLKYWDELAPKKTGDGEIENVRLADFLLMKHTAILTSNVTTTSGE